MYAPYKDFNDGSERRPQSSVCIMTYYCSTFKGTMDGCQKGHSPVQCLGYKKV